MKFLNWSWLADRAGIANAVLCGVHCAGVAWLLATTPAVWFSQRLWGVPLSWLSVVEYTLAGLSLALAVAGLGTGWWLHRRPAPILIGAMGLALVMSVFVIRWHQRPLLGPALVVAGGLLLVVAHLYNLRLRARCQRRPPKPAVTVPGPGGPAEPRAQ